MPSQQKPQVQAPSPGRRSDLKIRAALAETEQQLARLEADHELSAGEKLKRHYYFDRERERLQLRLELPNLQRALGFAKAKYQFACSPAGEKKAQRDAANILAGRAMGAGQGRVWRDPNEFKTNHNETKAKAELASAQEKVDAASERLRFLGRSNGRLKAALTVEGSLPVRKEPVAETHSGDNRTISPSDLALTEGIASGHDFLGMHEGAGQRPLLVRVGDVWSLSFGDEQGHFTSLLGMEYIANLLAKPGIPIRATELARRAPPASSDHSAENSTISDGRLFQERLDNKARTEYEGRIRHLAAEAHAARKQNDLGKLPALENEIEQIREQLEADTGQRGRGRTFSDSAEKARDSVRKAIYRAFKLISRDCPKAAKHLKGMITLGFELVYRDATTGWSVSER